MENTANKKEQQVRSSTKLSMKEWNITTPMLMDYSGYAGKRFGARTTPHMFVVSPEGILVYRGAICDREDLSKNHVVNAVKLLHNGEKVLPNEVKPWGCGVKYAK